MRNPAKIYSVLFLFAVLASISLSASAADIDGKWVFQKFTCTGGESALAMPFERYKHEITFKDEAFDATVDQVAKQKGKKISCTISSKGKFSIEGDQLTLDVKDSKTKGAKDCVASKGALTSEFQLQNDELRITVPKADKPHQFCPDSQAVQVYVKNKI